jgi:hypothetical protein
LPTDEEGILRILGVQKACEWGELKARAWKESNQIVTRMRVRNAFQKLKTQGKVDEEEWKNVKLECKTPPSKPPLFVYSRTVDSTAISERQQIINEKKQLLQWHFDVGKQEIGKYAEQLVQQVCQELHYKSKVHRREKFAVLSSGTRRIEEIDVYGKHPSNKYWQAISVKNWRDPIRVAQVQQIVDIVALARQKWKRDIRPAIVAPTAYDDAMKKAKLDHVPIALLGRQVAPESHRRSYQELNDRLAFDFEITAKPPKLMRDNIEEYLVKRG